MKAVPSCSLVVSAYNWPVALEASLLSAFQQSVQPKEIVVCDDGSEEATREVIDQLRAACPVPLLHVWQKGDDSRKAAVLNKAVAVTTGDYIIETDQETILHRHYIKDQLRNCKRGHFLTSRRCCTGATTVKKTFGFKSSLEKPLLKGTMSGIASLWLPTAQRNVVSSTQIDRLATYIAGCNLSFWRDDFIRINGYDEGSAGWGWESYDLALRLMNSGIKLAYLRFAALPFSLYQSDGAHRLKLTSRISELAAAKENVAFAERGVHQYLPSLNVKPEVIPVNWYVRTSPSKVPA